MTQRALITGITGTLRILEAIRILRLEQRQVLDTWHPERAQCSPDH